MTAVSVAVRESVTVSGQAVRAKVARGFVGGVLGPGHPCAEEAVVLVSELFGNSVRYSSSSGPGGVITVSVAVLGDGGVIRVEVADRSGPSVPRLCPAGGDAESGRGLGLVAALSARWGWQRRGSQTVTWFELRHG
jgi:anti-sigma regulatory factor (Ser/Thr protein kinase)